MTDQENRRRIDAHLGRALIELEKAHGLITPETHGDNYHPVINEIEDVLEKVRGAATA